MLHNDTAGLCSNKPRLLIRRRVGSLPEYRSIIGGARLQNIDSDIQGGPISRNQDKAYFFDQESSGHQDTGTRLTGSGQKEAHSTQYNVIHAQRGDSWDKLRIKRDLIIYP